MPEITSYVGALQAIWNRSGYDRGFISNPFAGDDAARLGLVRTQALLTHLGHDPLPYAIVHVAGSKGKGSTCVMIDSVLQHSGVRTGRYMSPQLHSFRERFVVNGQMISESAFINLTDRYIRAAETIEREQPKIGQITAFELSTAMALGWFAEQECDVAVIEVGLGGTLDATNIVTPTVSVITTLDYEHTAILGDTLAEIASNKAGIIKESRPVVCAVQAPEAMDVIRGRARDMQSLLLVAGRDWHATGHNNDFTFDDGTHRLDHLSLALAGDHQVANAGLTIAALFALEQEDSRITVTTDAIRAGLAQASLPARFEQTQLANGTIVVVDGAHTPKSATALAAALDARYPATKITLVIGMLADKNPEAVLIPLLPLSEHVFVVQPQSPRAMSADNLHATIRNLGRDGEIATSIERALEHASTSVVVVTGSFTTAADARIALGLAESVDPPTS